MVVGLEIFFALLAIAAAIFFTGTIIYHIWLRYEKRLEKDDNTFDERNK